MAVTLLCLALSSWSIGGELPPLSAWITVSVDESTVVRDIAFHPDGSLFAVATDREIVIRDGHTGSAIVRLREKNKGANCVAFSGDGKWLSAGRDDHTAAIWSVADGKQLAVVRVGSGTVNTVGWTSDSQQFWAGGTDSTIRWFDLATLKPVQTIKERFGAVQSAIVTPDNRHAILLSEGLTPRLYEVATGKLIFALRTAGRWISSIALNSQTGTVAAGGYDGALKIWSGATLEPQPGLPPDSAALLKLAFDPAGTILATGSSDRWIHILSADSLELLAELEGHRKDITALAFSPDGRRLVSGGADRRVVIWELYDSASVVPPSSDSLKQLLTQARPYPETGTSYALMIAVEEYAHWKRLVNPVADIKRIGRILETDYGFNVSYAFNPSKQRITALLDSLSHCRFNEGDRLLVYYAGHGEYDSLEQKGYITGSDSRVPDRTFTSTLPYNKLLAQIDSFSVAELLFVVDACFAGTIGSTRGDTLFPISDSTIAIERMIKQNRKKRSRIWVTS